MDGSGKYAQALAVCVCNLQVNGLKENGKSSRSTHSLMEKFETNKFMNESSILREKQKQQQNTTCYKYTNTLSNYVCIPIFISFDI